MSFEIQVLRKMNTLGESDYHKLQQEMEELEENIDAIVEEKLKKRKQELEDAHYDMTKKMKDEFDKKEAQFEAEFERKVDKQVDKKVDKQVQKLTKTKEEYRQEFLEEYQTTFITLMKQKDQIIAEKDFQIHQLKLFYTDDEKER